MWATCLIATFIGINAYAQESVDKFIFLADSIARNGTYVASTTIGIKASPSKQYKLGKRLGIASTEQQLMNLCNHQSPAVRIYAFKALGQKNKALQRHIYYQNLRFDQTIIRMLNGCVNSQIKANLVYRTLL